MDHNNPILSNYLTTANFSLFLNMCKKYLGDSCSKESEQTEKQVELYGLALKCEIYGPRDIFIEIDKHADSWVGPEQPES